MQTQTPTVAQETPASKPASQTLFFRKELHTNVVIVAGKRLHEHPSYTAHAGNRGLVMVDPEKDKEFAAALVDLARKQSGGIVQISAEEAEDFKKKAPILTSPERRSSRSDAPRLAPSGLPKAKTPENTGAAAPVVGDPPTPFNPRPIEQITVPPPEAGFVIPQDAQESTAIPVAKPPPRHKPTTRKVAQPKAAPSTG